MNPGDILYSLFTFLMIILFVAGPMMKRAAARNRRRKSHGTVAAEASEESFYESVDSHRVVRRMLEKNKADKKIYFSTPPVDSVVSRQESHEKRGVSVTARIEELSPLRKGMVWKEILSRPAGLRDPGGDLF